LLYDFGCSQETPRVIQRKTQTAEYWQGFSLTDSDIEFLHNVLFEADEPLTTQALAQALVAERVRREETELRAELGKGALYQPKNHYSIGDKLLFPAFDFRLGQVIASRAGHNPEHGEFEVLTVDFGPYRRQRAFAAGLNAAHKLNIDTPDLLAGSGVASPEKLLATVAVNLPAALPGLLAQTSEFASFENRWLLRDLLAELHVGHLNIAEALIEMRGLPVESSVLVKELELPKEIKPEVQAFSLQSSLSADGRFDQVGPGDSRRWFLRRLEPAEALSVPEALRHTPAPYDRSAISVELLQLEWELDDEWTEESQAGAAPRANIPSTTILLTYPHLISGTLPISSHSRSFFPTGHGDRTMVTLIDGRWGQRFSGWVVRGGRYVAGLRPWFDEHKLPAGAFIVLERKDDPTEVVVDFRPKRMRREWARMARVVDGRLDFELRKQAVSCEYDEQVILGVEETDAVLKLRDSALYANAPLPDLVYQVFADLAGLSQQGSVHAKTLYSAINVVRRLPPGPIFAELASDSRLHSIGDGFYRLAGDTA
jgi:hypothetical protein